MSKLSFSRITPEGEKKTLAVFGRGLLDTLDDAFWMLPFSSKKQAHLIRQEMSIPDEDWQRRRDLISAEHRHADARKQLTDGWKAWIGQESFSERREAAKARRSAAGAKDIPEYDE